MPARHLVLIVAMDRNRAIGRGGQLPWHLPADLRHFKQTTMGSALLMGRKTFQAIGRPLPGRQNIVLTHAPQAQAKPEPGNRRLQASVAAGIEHPDVQLAADIDAAVALAESQTVFVVGGGEVYRQTIGQADQLIVTEVDTAISDADTWFPEIDTRRWQETERIRRPADDNNRHAMSFVTWRQREH